MDQSRKFLRILSIILFLIGILVGLAFEVIAVFSDVESTLYFPSPYDRRLNSLHCPVLVAQGETGKISASFTNSLNKVISPTLRAEISTKLMPETVDTQVSINPGETKRVEWDVTEENIDLGYFIFARVYTPLVYPIPARVATCGILVVSLAGLTGGQLTAILVTLSVVGILGGLILWPLSTLQTERISGLTNGMRFLGVIVVLGIVASLLGWWWGISGILLAIGFLTTISVASYTIASGRFD